MPDWHPILALVEDAPGFWRMVAQYGRSYGTVRLLKRGGEVGYRADSIAALGAEARLVGYFTNLRAAAGAIHQAEIARIGVRGAPNSAVHSSRPL